MKTDPQRNRELAKIHLGAKALGWDDATYRAVLLRLSGQTSAGDLDARHRRVVLDYMKEQGFRPDAARKPHKMTTNVVEEIRMGMQRREDEPAHHAFIRALWDWLGDHGELTISPFGRDSSLNSFVYRQTGIALLKWLTPDQSAKVVEALKKWVYRAAKRASSGDAV